MSSLQTTFDGKSFVDVAIERIQKYEPADGYEVGFSGGKDSVVVLDLVRRAGVQYEAQYKSTTVDPPEVVVFIRHHYPDVTWVKPRASMYQLIRKHKMLPTRMVRFCCSELKEFGGKGKTIITGIRSAESRNRKKREYYEQSRHVKSKWFLHPIFEWSDQDVWDYISDQRLPYCSLYDEGKTRIGCIMCPMQGEAGMRIDAARYPKHFAAYLRAIQAVINGGHVFKQGDTAEEVMEWWMSGKKKP